MATGMVLIIVTRNIDLSIGSMLGFIGMVMGVIQTDAPAAAARLRTSGDLDSHAGGRACCSASPSARLQGFVIAYLGIPAFIVTLGGLLVWRGAAWWVTTRTDGRAA